MYIANNERYELMKYRRCGQSGLLLPLVTLGLWHNFGDTGNFDTMRKMVLTAFDHGITHFDLANNYGPEPGSAEINFGRILREDLLPYRDELIITTKAGYTMWPGPYGDNGSRKYLMASIDQSLKRLGLDYVDIFYHHRMDKNTPLEETMIALRDIVLSGKALYVGLSNYDGETLIEATQLLTKFNTPFIVNQNRYNIHDRTIENNNLLTESGRLGKGVVVFSPLAQGTLTDRYLQGIPSDSRIATDGRFLDRDKLSAEVVLKAQRLNDVAKSRGESLAVMALAWVLNNPTVTSVIIGASKPEQIIENIKVINSKPFTKEQLEIIDDIAK